MDDPMYLNDDADLVEEYPVKTFVAQLCCKKCGSVMNFTGTTLTSNPPWFPHACSNGECNWNVCVRSRYPKTIMRAINCADATSTGF